MAGAARDLAEFLRDDAGERVSWLENDPDAIAKIGNGDAIPRDEQHDHRFTDHAAKAEQDGGEDAAPSGRDYDAEDGLLLRGSERLAGGGVGLRDAVEGVLS